MFDAILEAREVEDIATTLEEVAHLETLVAEDMDCFFEEV